MKRIIILLVGVLSLSITAIIQASNKPQATPEKTIGIVMPLDHSSLRAIIRGFEESISRQYPGKVNFQIANAEHDLNIQHAIIQKFINQKVDLIVPLGTSTTQMTMSMVKSQPIIGLAANFPESIGSQNNLAEHFTVVPDEIDANQLIHFLQGVLPQAKKLTLIYSVEDKVIRAVAEIRTIAARAGIRIQPLMIANLSDLYSVSQRVDRDSQGIFILKDNLVASGINTLIKVAKQKHLALITSDEDTVQSGAAAALGVEEKKIGEAGGNLAVKVLNGASLTQMPIASLQTLQIFVNDSALKNQNVNLENIKSYAAKNHYQIKILPKTI